MPPRAPVVWSGVATRSDRIQRRLDERHRDLSREARSLGARYRGSRKLASAEGQRLRTGFLTALGRLAAFEAASLRLSRCRVELQVAAHADDLSRDYFKLWQVLARRSALASVEGETSTERLDHFATQLGRLEGLADALLIAGRNVRLFRPPAVDWVRVTAG